LEQKGWFFIVVSIVLHFNNIPLSDRWIQDMKLWKANQWSDLLVKIFRNEPKGDTPLNQMRRVTKENPQILGHTTFKKGLQENISLAERRLAHRLTIINP
jgi:hypothetical protein